MNKIILTLAIGASILLQGCAEDDPIVCTTQNILLDGDFEDVTSGWTEFPGTGVVIGAYGNPAPNSAGSKYARFLDQNSVTHRISQVVYIPYDTKSLTLSGYRDFLSADIDANADTLSITIYSGLGSSENVDVLNNLDTTSDWVGFSYGLLSNYAGQTITVEIEAISDIADVSTFYLDDLSLDAESCS